MTDYELCMLFAEWYLVPFVEREENLDILLRGQYTRMGKLQRHWEKESDFGTNYGWLSLFIANAIGENHDRL